MPTPIANPLLVGTLSNLATVVKPVPEDTYGAPAPDNSEIRKIAEDVLGALKYSFAAVAANQATAVRPNSVEADFKSALERLPAQKREQAQRTATELVSASSPARIALFGRAGERSAEEHIGAVGGFARFDEGLAPLVLDRKLLGLRTPSITAPLESLRASSEGLLIPASLLPTGFESFRSDFESAGAVAADTEVMDDARLADIWGAANVGDPFADSASGSEFEEFATTDKMGFWITKVKCVDETNPEWWGSDEIALAGVSVDETGDTKKISEKYIGGGFDDGDSKSYSNYRYHWFSLREGEVWPKTYSVSLILAEKDNGGLSDFLNSVWEKVGKTVKEKIQAAVTAGLTPYLGAAIASAIGAAVAWVIDVFVKWIISLWKDDIFPPFTARVTTPSMSARWHYPNGTWGNPSSGVRTAHFYGHGGHYYVQYYWKFFA